MSVSVPNGALVAIASGYSAPVTVTAVTNATPAVASAVNTFTAGDIVEFTSGWSRVTNKVVRVAAPSGTAFSLEGVDTTLTSIYPVAGGAGTARKVSGWTQLAQILSSASSGGEQQFLTYQFLEADAEKKIPTVKSAFGLTFSVADDATQPGFILASAANDDRLPRAIRITLPSGAVLLYNGYISLNKTPSLTINELMAVEVTVSLLAEPVRY
jgi:Phage tail tube protein, TTP